MRLNWNNLITSERLEAEPYYLPIDARTEFEKDLDRIIFSSPFRRLKDKTQVFPVPKSDFIHNRLTHSIEVSSIGRALGKLCGKFILEKEGTIIDPKSPEQVTPSTFGHIVAAACLAHDIGNPPFGHSGEQSFRIFFEDFFNEKDEDGTPIKIYKWKKRFIDNLSETQKNDFLKFEGNAEGFRILTNEHPSGISGGLKLTYSTLGAFTKYPCESVINSFNESGKKCTDRHSTEKVGFFQSEKEIFTKIAERLGLIRFSDDQFVWSRHPLAFIVEAADNISYSLMDIEDGHKLRLIQTHEVVDLLRPIATSVPGDPCNINDFEKILDVDEKVGAYRAKALTALIYHTFEAFKDKYEEIMTGEYDDELTNSFEVCKEFKSLKKTIKRFFSNDKVVSIEFAGMHVVKGLLEIYLDAHKNLGKKYAENLIGNLPTQFQFVDSTNEYDVLLKISTFISRMTDSYALDFFRKLSGHKLPEIN